MQKTSAWPLALACIGLVVYASLYPFEGWRSQGLAPWELIRWPRYWSTFDVVANAMGYLPLGFLLAVSAMRMRLRGHAVLWAALACTLLSLAMETLQVYLPRRVPSAADWALNSAGGLAGAALAYVLERLGALDRWSHFRTRWFVPQARGALVMLALWPPALLYPVSVPFGLGQVLERLEEALGGWLADTPFVEWLPLREVELQPMLPLAAALCVLMGVLAPCLLGYSVIRGVGRRALFALLALAAGLGMTALSAALSYGPQHAWAWVTPPARLGLATAVVLLGVLLALPRRLALVLALLALMLQLALINNAPASVYFGQTLQSWEQGRFIHFYGVTHWLGQLWPYLALLVLVRQLARRDQDGHRQGGA